MTYAQEFLTSKFNDCNGFLIVWTKQSKSTRAFPINDIAQAASFVESASKTQDVYVSISTQTEAPSDNKRGTEGSTCSLTGLFVDIDFAEAKGEQTNYPPNQEIALSILEKLPIQPTWVIGTGNGLHAHFDFDQPIHFTTQDDREIAKNLSKNFQQFVLNHYKIEGYKIDYVPDLVRNCRIPGTLNHKSSTPKFVEIIKHNPDARISVEKISQLIANEKSPAKQKKATANTLLANHDLITKQCRWYREIIVDGAIQCSEPDWFAGASITALCVNGEQIFFNYSQKYPKFNEQETGEKFSRAVKYDAPRTCNSIAKELGHENLCNSCPHYGFITTPLQLGRENYDPGDNGPLPLGYSAEGNFIFLDQARQIILVATSSQLLTMQFLLGVMPTKFWAKQFPPKKDGQSFDPWAAGQTLMESCRIKGPFDPQTIRGRGVWLESGKIIINLGKPIPNYAKIHYLCFEALPLAEVKTFDVLRLQKALQLFRWRNPQDAILLLGWLALAPICGVLNWRPHCFLYGPPNCGKSTLHSIASNLLKPLGLSVDGQSSEAGIRQRIKADSRPVIIDEFESDQVRGNLNGVLRLARSASSSESPVLRGTPEGKAIQFALRTCFFFAAVNPSGMSPADQTRILLLEMLKHKNDPIVAAEIAEDEIFFADKGPEWCGYMAGLAHLVPSTINSFKKALPGLDSRHRQNISSLLAGTFVALNRKLPTDDQAVAIANEFKSIVDLHAESFERDDGAECLHQLLMHKFDGNAVGYWIAAAIRFKGNINRGTLYADATRICRNLEIILRVDDDQPCIMIRKNAPAINELYRDTRWANGAWDKALRKLEGCFTPKKPIHFPSIGSNARAIGISTNLLPDFNEEDFFVETRF